MILNEYQSVIREHFDISDNKTRKMIIALEDSQQNQLMAALASALYDKVVSNVDKIDFGSIPKSKGDITKVDGFNNTEECLNIIRSLVVEYKEDTSIVDTVITAIANMKSLKPVYVKGFTLNVNFITVFYNLITLAIEQSVSFMIAVSIQFIKDSSSQTLNMALDKAAYNDAKNNMLFEQLYGFNKSFASGELESLLRDAMKGGAKLNEATVPKPEEVEAAEDLPDGAVSSAPPEDALEECGDIDPAQLCAALNSLGYKIVKKDDAAETEAPVDEEPEEVPCPGAECPPAEDDQESEPTPTMPINGDAEVAGDEVANEMGIVALGLTVAGVAVIGLKALILLVKWLIPTLRNITYYIINLRVSFADSLAVQAQLIEINAYKLQYSTSSDLDQDKKNKVVDKQLKIAAKLKSLSSKFALNDKKAKKEAEKAAEEDKKKTKADDIKDKLPDEISSDGDLF